ncbi:MAG: hypothetical protein ABEJ95_01520 [Candidatus Nanohalobium sp.]
MEQYREVLDDLEEQVEKTEQEFDQVKDMGSSEKQQEAEELINEIKSQISFLEKQMDRKE